MKGLSVSFLALCSPVNRVVGHDKAFSLLTPRSNETHLIWKELEDVLAESSSATLWKDRRPSDARSLRSEQVLPKYQVQTLADAEDECLKFLQDNIMTFDLPFQETMGFPTADDGGGADGLGDGLIQRTIQLALRAKREYPWTDELPKEIFMEYVLNYANLNEARTNWRPLLVEALKFNESELWMSGKANLTSVVTWVNTHLWTKLGRGPDRPIIFKSSQTPLIFDPMSTIAFGYASCTGTSILFANALRALGIPARVVGTPAWYGDRLQGNHNWVEVFDINVPTPDKWKFLEPSPANAGLDTLDKDPCERWFCQASRYPASRVYAARLLKDAGSTPATFFPLAWEWKNQDVPGVDRTQYYTNICQSCGNR